MAPKELESQESLLDNKGFSRSTHLSVLYATILVLLGFVFPMSEALRDEWLTNHVIGAYMAYLFSGASAFILYLQIYEAILRRKHTKAEQLPQVTTESYTPQTTQGADNPALEDPCSVQISEEDKGCNVNTSDSISERNSDTVSTHVVSSEGVPDDDKLVDTMANFDHQYREPQLVYEADLSDSFNVRNRTRIRSSNHMPSEASDDVYDYITSHHGTATIASGHTNYFMKGGTLIFAIANMVYVALRIEGEHQRSRCDKKNRIIYPHYVHLFFIVLQTFLLAKDIKFSLRKNKALASFGLMHLVATNMCVWLRYLVIEVLEGLHHEAAPEDHSAFSDNNETDDNTSSCDVPPVMVQAGPYLFPFILEYSLVATSTIIFMFGNINIRLTRELYRAVCTALHKKRLEYAKATTSGTYSPYQKHQMTLDKSHKGLSFGMVVLAAVVVSMILFFYWKASGDDEKAQMCYVISELILIILLIASGIVGMRRLFHFVFNINNTNTLDHALLLFPVAFLMVMELFELLAMALDIQDNGPENIAILSLTASLFGIIQSIIQIAFIIDGMQRVTVEEEHVRRKHGRGAITFLIILNVAMWIFESFQAKKSDHSVEMEMYGEVAWTIISSVALPLELFFYFHSAICLAHMWHNCYSEPEATVHNSLKL